MVQGPVLARAFPFALFMAFIALQPLLEGRMDARWLAVARGLAAGAALLCHDPGQLVFFEDRRVHHPSSSSRSIACRSSSFDAVAVPIFITTIPPA